MTNRRTLLAGIAGLTATVAAAVAGRARAAETFRITHTDAEWRAQLSHPQYLILRRQATEKPDASPLAHETGSGKYACAGCGQVAFSSDTKYASHTGWPSFWAPVEGAVAQATDTTYFTKRTEIHCTACGGHLGHVFKDGPKPTGLRYCMNGLVLNFIPGTA